MDENQDAADENETPQTRDVKTSREYRVHVQSYHDITKLREQGAKYDAKSASAAAKVREYEAKAQKASHTL